jgi:hypothetical protein
MHEGMEISTEATAREMYDAGCEEFKRTSDLAQSYC